MQLTVLMAETNGRFQVLTDIRQYFVREHSVNEPKLVASTTLMPIERHARNGRQMNLITSEVSVVCSEKQAQLFKQWCGASNISYRKATSSEKEKILRERQRLRTGLKKIAASKNQETT